MQKSWINKIIAGVTLIAGIGLSAVAETPKDVVINSVEALLKKPFQAKLSSRMIPNSPPANLTLWYQPESNGTVQKKIEIMPIGVDQSFGFTAYTKDEECKTVRYNNYGKHIVLNLKGKDLMTVLMLTGGTFIALDEVFPNIKEVAELPGVVFENAPDEKFNKTIPCRVITMTAANNRDDLLRQIGLNAATLPPEAKIDTLPIGSHFKWIIGKKDGFVYSYQLVIPGIDREKNKQKVQIFGEWYVDQVSFPQTFPADTFLIPEKLESFSVANRDDFLSAIRQKETASSSQQLAQTTKKAINSWQTTTWWILGGSLFLILAAVLLKLKPWKK